MFCKWKWVDQASGLCVCSYLIMYKRVRPLCFLMYDIRPTVSTTADNFGTEISPSIDCHKCPLTSLGVGLGLGEGRPGFLWLYSRQSVCSWCKLFSFSLCNSTLSFAAKYYAAAVWSDDLFSLCWVMDRLGEAVGLAVWCFVVSDLATWCLIPIQSRWGVYGVAKHSSANTNSTPQFEQ